MIREFIKKFGVVRTSIFITIIVSLLSVVLDIIISVLLNRVSLSGIIVAFIIPVSIAPFLTFFVFRLVARLDLSEEALRASETKFKELANSLPQFVFETDIKGNVTYANCNAYKEFGYTHEDLQKGLNVTQMIAPEDRTGALANIKKIFKGKKSEGFEYTALRKDGSTFPVLIHSNLIIRENTPKGLRGIMVDLSSSKKAEKERVRLESRLKQAEKMEAIGTLAGGVAHDLNNILSGIVSYPELLLMQLPGDSSLIKPIKTIQEAGNKAAAIVQDLLTFARRGVNITEAVDLNNIVAEYLRGPVYKKLTSYHPNVDTEIDLSEELLNIMGSPVHLSQIIMNLVSNAFEAITGNGKILLSTENRYLSRIIKGYDDVEEGDYVVLKVSDTGVGMSQGDMEKIFEPFYTKKKMGRSGTGLGMTVVWGIVKDHKAYIDIESIEGKSTTFTLYFPITREGLVRKDSVLRINEIRGNGELILVVDDAKEQREIASAILTELGYAVETMSSGEDAVDYMKQNSIDLLVIDMIMDPGMDGLETYKRINEINPGQRAIIASGFSETGRVKEAQRLGVGEYIKKPYTIDNIGAAVRKELDK